VDDVKRLVALTLAASGVFAGGLWWSAAPAAATQVTPNAVTWSVDQNAKVITGKVKLRITPRCSPSMLAGRTRNPALRERCTVTTEIADAIKANAERIWNNGNTFKCYAVQIDVDVEIDNDPRGQQSSDRVDIQIDQASGNITSSIATVGPTNSAWNSARYEDRSRPVNDTERPSTLSYPPPRDVDANLYAHEVGHVLGLEDGYETVRDPQGNEFSRTRADAPDDLMSHQGNPTVHQSTIDVLIARSGVFLTEPIKCDYKIDTTIEWYHFTSLKCGSAEGIWNLTVDGVYDLGGASLVLAGAGTATLAKTGTTFSGTWDASFTINLQGVPQSIGGQEGTITGDAVLDSSVLRINGTNASGDFWAQTPALALSGGVNPLKSFDLPVENDQFC
jgi:hypothetical protein